MKKISVVFSFLFFSSAFSFAWSVEVKESAGFKYYQELLTTTVPFETGVFSKETRQILITGVLYTPYSDNKKIYPLVVFSHGSQDGGVTFPFNGIGVMSRSLLERGYAYFIPIRKGFNVKGTPESEVNANSSEPVACGDWESSMKGVISAISDTKALLKVLSERPEIDLSKIILMGQSRGGFLSLALAADGLPGVEKVVNLSGGWYSERCFAEFNRVQFEEFGKKIKVPIISFYGDNDSYYGTGHIQQNLRALGKAGMNTTHIFPGEPHSFWRKIDLWQPYVFGPK